MTAGAMFDIPLLLWRYYGNIIASALTVADVASAGRTGGARTELDFCYFWLAMLLY